MGVYHVADCSSVAIRVSARGAYCKLRDPYLPLKTPSRVWQPYPFISSLTSLASTMALSLRRAVKTLIL